MAVDVYVMPLWRYKAGDFQTTVERVFGGTTIIATRSGAFVRRVSPAGWFRRWRARREVAHLVRTASDAVGGDIGWPDEGDIIYSNQFRSGPTVLGYLWWRDRRDLFGDYRPISDRDPDAGTFWSAAPDRKLSLPHLAGNNYWDELFLPADFPNLVEVEPRQCGGGATETKTACSTTRALAELEVVVRELELPRNYDATNETDDPLVGVRLAFDHLRHILEASHQHRLPVIFWG